MTIQEAINMDRDFKRPHQIWWMRIDLSRDVPPQHFIYFTDGMDDIRYPLTMEDILATDWEIKQ
jgi:hypothetical protein